jgi:N utilization substance protein A
MGDMVISGAPVSVLMDYGMTEAMVEKLVGAGIGTVERLGSMTPEELEDIPGIDEEVVTRIQTSVVAFYGQYDNAQSEEAPVDPAAIEAAIDRETVADALDGEHPQPFKNIETGVLEHDLAKHEQALLEDTDEGEVLDLGKVEGLSAAPSTLRSLVQSQTAAQGAGTPESVESDTMSKID